MSVETTKIDANNGVAAVTDETLVSIRVEYDHHICCVNIAGVDIAYHILQISYDTWRIQFDKKLEYSLLEAIVNHIDHKIPSLSVTAYSGHQAIDVSYRKHGAINITRNEDTEIDSIDTRISFTIDIKQYIVTSNRPYGELPKYIDEEDIANKVGDSSPQSTGQQ